MRRRARVEGFGVGCVRWVRGMDYPAFSSHRLNIDILEWHFSKKACCTL